MERLALRCLVGGAITIILLGGCRSRSPFEDHVMSEGTRGGAVAASASAPAPREAAAPTSAVLPVLDERSALDAYQRYAALRNPGLEAAFQEWKAAVEELPQVSALPDPRLTYGYYLGEIETRVGPMQHAVSLSQTFPWFGKLQDREDAAARDAQAAYRRFEGARLELFLDVERAYNELYFLKQSIDITSATIELLMQFERVARSRYRVAAAAHPDLLKIQVELGTLEDRRRQLEDLRAPRVARLNAVLGRPAGAKVPWPGAIAERVADVDRAALRELLRRQNPELIARREEIERERIGSEIARKDGLPDFTVGVAYTAIGKRGDVSPAENGDDALLASVSVNLPIWRDKYDAAVREAVARRLAASGRHEDQANRLASDLETALFEHQDARRRVALYRDTLIPKATESLQASLGGFEQGTSDFLDLIDTERTLLEFQLALQRARVDRATSYARIEQLVGADLGSIISTTPAEATP